MHKPTLPMSAPPPPNEGTKCGGCGVAINWSRTLRGRWSPVNHDGTPHWATCPFADKFRRHMKKPGAKTIGEVLFADRLATDDAANAESQGELSEPV